MANKIELTKKQIVRLARAIGDETRLEVVLLLYKQELCENEILENFSISQPTLSHHLKVLCDAELVRTRKAAQKVYYSLTDYARGFSVTHKNVLVPGDPEKTV